MSKNEYFDAAISPIFLFDGYKGFNLTITNKTTNDLEVDWNIVGVPLETLVNKTDLSVNYLVFAPELKHNLVQGCLLTVQFDHFNDDCDNKTELKTCNHCAQHTRTPFAFDLASVISFADHRVHSPIK